MTNTTKRNLRTIRTGLKSNKGEPLTLEVAAWLRGRVMVSAVVTQGDGYRLRPFQFEADATASDADLIAQMLTDWTADNYGPHAENGWTTEVV